MYLTCRDPANQDTFYTHSSWMNKENKEAMQAIVNKHE